MTQETAPMMTEMSPAISSAAMALMDGGVKRLDFKDVERRTREFQILYDRFDIDRDLRFLKPYVMMGFDKLPIPLIINMTLNDPATFHEKVTGTLQGAVPQPVVKGKGMSDKQTTLIERFSDDLWMTIDDHLRRQGLWALHPAIVEQSCSTGRMAAWSLIRKNPATGKIIYDVRSIDCRYLSYLPSWDGMRWACVQVVKSKDELKEVYNIGIEQMSAVCWEVYDRNFYYFFVSGGKSVELARMTRHPFGEVPIVFEKVPTGSMMIHPDALAKDGEGIFALNRGLYPELNRLATVLHNLTMAAFFGARQYASEAGEGKKTQPIPYGLGVTVAIEKGGGYTLIPVNDIRNATRLEYAMLDTRLQRGSVPNIDYGNLTFPLAIGAIGKLKDARDIIYVPRLESYAHFYRKLHRMAVKQLVAIASSVELGEEGQETTYQLSELKGAYTLSYKYLLVSNDERQSRIQEAQNLRGLISDDSLRRDTLHVADPDGEMDKIRDEAAETIDPAIGMYRRTKSLIERESYHEAEMSLRTLETMLKQRTMQTALNQPPAPKGGGRQPPKLLPEGGQGGRGQKSEEQRVEDDINEEERVARLAETGRRGRDSEDLVGAER